jgi:hypothetical protein
MDSRSYRSASPENRGCVIGGDTKFGGFETLQISLPHPFKGAFKMMGV